MRASKARMLSTTCKVLRAGSVSGGKAAALAVYLTDVPCTPLMPLSAEAAARNGIEGPATRSVVYADGDYEIRSGDVIELDAKEMQIVAASRLPDRRGGDVLELVVAVYRTERF